MSDEDLLPEEAVSPDLPTEVQEKEESVPKILSHDSIGAAYKIKPALQNKFKEGPVKEILRDTQTNILSGKLYDPDSVKRWTIKIANTVNERLRELKMDRYKHIVQVVLGERKGQGVKSGVRCLWDSETDGYTNDIFMNRYCVRDIFLLQNILYAEDSLVQEVRLETIIRLSTPETRSQKTYNKNKKNK